LLDFASRREGGRRGAPPTQSKITQVLAGWEAGKKRFVGHRQGVPPNDAQAALQEN
jgi:hypothetical protein